MPMSRLTLAAPDHFDFWRTVYSHGWCSLPPFSYNMEKHQLSRTLETDDGAIISCMLSGGTKGIVVRTEGDSPLLLAQRKDITRQLSTCLQLDEDLEPFHRFVAHCPAYRWIRRAGAGRMLRAPTAFEDAVKILCTTNCTWALTTIMVTGIVRTAGKTIDNQHFAFPAPAALAELSESELRRHCKTGYRAPFIKEFARRVGGGELNVERWRESNCSTEELAKEIRTVKGMGPYAVGNMLRLVRRHDSLALDSWVRAQFSRLHKHGRKVKDSVIEREYEKYGEWRGLVFWLEMTRYWHEEKFTL